MVYIKHNKDGLEMINDLDLDGKIAFHRWLTEKVLGNKWYVAEKPTVGSKIFTNRTFKTWEDFGAVVERMNDNGMLDKFTGYLMYEKDILPIDVLTDKDLFFATLQDWWEREIKK
jgi:hypothetical protein